MDLMQEIIARAKANKQRIVLPEGTEERTLKAADRLVADEVADIILIGNPAEINSLAAQLRVEPHWTNYYYRSEESRKESRLRRPAFPAAPEKGYDSRKGCRFSRRSFVSCLPDD